MAGRSAYCDDLAGPGVPEFAPAALKHDRPTSVGEFHMCRTACPSCVRAVRASRAVELESDHIEGDLGRPGSRGNPSLVSARQASAVLTCSVHTAWRTSRRVRLGATPSATRSGGTGGGSFGGSVAVEGPMNHSRHSSDKCWLAAADHRYAAACPVMAFAFPPSAVRAPPAPLLHQPCTLQRLLHPAVAQTYIVLGLQLLVKMPHAQVEVRRPGTTPAPPRLSRSDR